jgi:hypothetical protein
MQIDPMVIIKTVWNVTAPNPFPILTDRFHWGIGSNIVFQLAAWRGITLRVTLTITLV